MIVSTFTLVLLQRLHAGGAGDGGMTAAPTVLPLRRRDVSSPITFYVPTPYFRVLG